MTSGLSLFGSNANQGIPWRLAAAFTFREIKARHTEGSDSTDPYIRFERFFAHDPQYAERFQNLVTGERIFIDYLQSNWLLELPIDDRITVASLFRRVENSENIGLALARRPLARENLSHLKNLDQDSLPQHLFVRDEPQHSALKSGLFSVRRALIAGPSDIIDGIGYGLSKGVWGVKHALGLVSALFLFIATLPISLLGALGLKGNTNIAVSSAAARKNLALKIGLKSSPHSVSRILQKYEMKYGHSEKAINALAHQFETSSTKSILTHHWLESIPLEHRVFVTSLLRKASKASNSLTFAPITPLLNSKNQRDIVQITGVSPQQRKELQLFRTIKHSTPQAGISPQNPEAVVKNIPRVKAEFSTQSSEDVLRNQGWIPQDLNGLDLVESIRSRSFRDVLIFTSSEKNDLNLPTPLKQQLASFAAILGTPVKNTNPNFKNVDAGIKSSDKISNSSTHMARLMKKANAQVLPLSNSTDLTLRHIWVRIANSIEDQVNFSEAIETLIAAYDAQPVSKISTRSVSFDTFLILDLKIILDRMKIWIDWDLCGRSSLVAFAYLATLTNDHKLFQTALGHLETLRGVPKALIGSIRNSFFTVGIHNIEGIISGIGNTKRLQTLDPKKKYLCLVEGGAGIRALRKLDGITKNVVCGPVIPTDAPRYPADATLKHIDDFIPKYSKRDMELGFEIDALVETYIQKTSDIIRKTGVNERYVEAVEIAHATMFFAIYQDALAVDVCETLLDDAKEYDGLIILLNSANVLGALLPEALTIFGHENVFIGLENERSKGFDVAIKNVRQAVRPRKTPAVKASETPLEWAPAFSKWLSATMSVHEKNIVQLPEQDYALLTLEHVNGYYDSYLALTEQSLKHMNVEIFTSIANPAINNYIADGGFNNPHYSLTHCSVNERAAPARDWTQGLIAELKHAFEGIENPWFPKYKNMIHLRAETMLTNRLPQILDAVSYFRARFSHNRPEYVFTGPNQHTISRAASYAAMALDIPVYDFLILASTHHPRYRHPVAKYAYIYDPWYRDIFEDYMRMPADKIRVSGPLFDYSKRLSHSGAPNTKLKNKTHIVFFSQSGNFQNSCNMLEGICKGAKKFNGVYITVKMHPHESPANLKHYADFAARMGVIENINIIHHGDAVALINEADLVVQSFSNVGLDALLMRTPVITYKPPSNLKARIFLYEKDIGHVVKTKSALATKVKKFLGDPEDKIRMKEMADTFAAQNEHFLRSDNAERVMAEVLIDIGKSPKTVSEAQKTL